jgi:hypothetical protein
VIGLIEMVREWLKSKVQGLFGNINNSVHNFAKGAFEKGKSVLTKVGHFAKDTLNLFKLLTL